MIKIWVLIFAAQVEETTRQKAKVAQLVERDLAKVEVAGSNPVFRSKVAQATFFFQVFRSGDLAGMVELVDTWDLKSHVRIGRAGSTPAPGTAKSPFKGLFCF